MTGPRLLRSNLRTLLDRGYVGGESGAALPTWLLDVSLRPPSVLRLGFETLVEPEWSPPSRVVAPQTPATSPVTLAQLDAPANLPASLAIVADGTAALHALPEPELASLDQRERPRAREPKVLGPPADPSRPARFVHAVRLVPIALTG